MEIPKHWRLKKQRYLLQGNVCPNSECREKIFPPRPICPNCHGETSIYHSKRDSGEIYNTNLTSLPKEASNSSK